MTTPAIAPSHSHFTEAGADKRHPYKTEMRPRPWKREHLAELDATGPAKASPTAMAAEIDPLRKQLAKEKRINEILKKRSAPAPRKTKPLRVHATPTNQV